MLISDPIISHVYLFIHEASKAMPVNAAKLQIVGNPFIHACKHVFFFIKRTTKKKNQSLIHLHLMVRPFKHISWDDVNKCVPVATCKASTLNSTPGILLEEN